MSQNQYTNHYEYLKNKWSVSNKQLHKSLWERHTHALQWVSNYAKHTAIGSVSAFMLLTAPVTATPVTLTIPIVRNDVTNETAKQSLLMEDLSYGLPDKVQPLTPFQQQVIGQTLTRHFNIPVTATLQNIRLNSTYGYIGAEQHLARFPGDTIDSHFDSINQANEFASSGMAPGLGAWGYFAQSQFQFSEIDKQREKYYIAVQTFLSPGYNNDVNTYSAFFKYRKMLVVNPQNGKAIVADIADAGPSEWTGKQLGGSPEVMHYLERVDGAEKGPVLYFFIDDTNNEIPLGPIETK